MGRGAAFKRWAEKADRDPALWPVAPGVRVYMVDCEFCTSKLPVSAMTFHMRRHARLFQQAAQ